VSGLALSNVAKRFGETLALDGVSLSVGPGEVLALTGPSGAGKTTLCRMVAGLEKPDAGSVRLGGQSMDGVPAGKRGVAFLFESYALYPHLTVRENALSPLRAPGSAVPRERHDATLKEVLTLLEIAHLGDRLPVALSGGQKQRAALARALVQSPRALLLDEPISHLDAKLRHKLRGAIRKRLMKRDSPSIWATPDGLEALSVGDKVAVIDKGRIEQLGTPEEIWLNPASVTVARLIGDPPMSVLGGELVEEAGATSFRRAGLQIALPNGMAAAARGRNVWLGLRASELALKPAGEAGAVTGEIYSHEPFGKHEIVTFSASDGAQIKIKTRDAAQVRIGEAAGLSCPPAAIALFDGETGRAISASAA
jgi:multiple sugar transport system ATP-binding protein